MKVKILTLIGIFLLCIISIIAYFAGPWALLYIGIQLGPNPPKPEIRYGEFPFRLEYEINGQRKVIQDTLICEYDGIGSNEGQGKFRKWKERLASGNENVTLLKVDETKEIYYNPGKAQFYMGDSEETIETYFHFPDAFISVRDRDSRIARKRLIEADQLLDEYGIKLIKWDYTKPIKNKFS